MPPPLQIGRPIGFAGTGGLYSLNIRPEELTRYEPSRLAVQQALGGAWIDGFDRGIVTIKIQGHTGWRGTTPTAVGGASNGLSGEDQFAQLRATSFLTWHSRRAQIVAGGGDPNTVELIFIDTLNRMSDLVAPKSFTLRRSKSRPLLMMYTIEMLVLQDLASASFGFGGAATNGGFIFGGSILDGAAAVIDGLTSGIGALGGQFGL
jgi:hypothetical protein